MTKYHFYSGIPPATPKGQLLKIGTDVYIGDNSTETHFGVPSSLEIDLLTIAAAIFAADRGTLRGEREDVARTLELHVPIVNIGTLQPLIPTIEEILRTLSNDLWFINFDQKEGTLTTNDGEKNSPGKVLLFSGGLDSLAAAIEFSKGKENLALVSHTTRNQQTIGAQRQLYNALLAKGLNLSHYSYFVSSRNAGTFVHDLESSQRTRSFLFLTIAAITANCLGRTEILLMAENGQMAIHLALSSARIGAFSTHTAHPDVLVGMEEYFSAAFGFNMKIENPYVHKTKREVIKPVLDSAPELIRVSNSCWKSARLPKGATHCGECIPCFIRRIAIESYQADPTAYARDLFSESFKALPGNDEGRRNIADLAEFTQRFETDTDQAIYEEWPELYSSNIDAQEVVSMYRRAAVETRQLLSKYPIGSEVLI